MIDYAFVVLAVVFIGSNLFWAFVTHRLINKVMSRDFTEYNLNVNKPTTRTTEKPVEPRVDPVLAEWEDKRMKEINGLFGF